MCDVLLLGYLIDSDVDSAGEVLCSDGGTCGRCAWFALLWRVTLSDSYDCCSNCAG